MIINELKKNKVFRTKSQSEYLDAIDKLDHSKPEVLSYEVETKGSEYIIHYTVNEIPKMSLGKVIGDLERYAKIRLSLITQSHQNPHIYRLDLLNNPVPKIINIINKANQEAIHYKFKFLDSNKGDYQLAITEYPTESFNL